MHLLLIEILYSDDLMGPGIKVMETWIVLQNVGTVHIILMLTCNSSCIVWILTPYKINNLQISSPFQ